MSAILGYVKSAGAGQNVQAKIDQLSAAGASTIFKEESVDPKRNTQQLAKLMAVVCKGDKVVVTGLEQIARNTRHLLQLVETFSEAGVSLQVLDSGIDTGAPNGEHLLTLLGVIADFERHTVRERQAEGIARAKREGRYKGRKPTAMAKADEVLMLSEQGMTRQKIADQLGIGVASVYRILKNQTLSQKPRRAIKPKQKPVEAPMPVEVEPVEVEPVEEKQPERKKPRRKKAPEVSADQLSFF